MDQDGNIVKENDTFGCKLTDNIFHPDMCIVFDDTGGKKSQKVDRHDGGKYWFVDVEQHHKRRHCQSMNNLHSEGWCFLI